MLSLIGLDAADARQRLSAVAQHVQQHASVKLDNNNNNFTQNKTQAFLQQQTITHLTQVTRATSTSSSMSSSSISCHFPPRGSRRCRKAQLCQDEIEHNTLEETNLLQTTTKKFKCEHQIIDLQALRKFVELGAILRKISDEFEAR